MGTLTGLYTDGTPVKIEFFDLGDREPWIEPDGTRKRCWTTVWKVGETVFSSQFRVEPKQHRGFGTLRDIQGGRMFADAQALMRYKVDIKSLKDAFGNQCTWPENIPCEGYVKVIPEVKRKAADGAYR